MRTSGADADGANGINLVQLLDVWKTRNLRLMVVAALKHLTQIHPSHTLCRLGSVVIVVDVDDETAQKLPDSISNLVLELIELTGFYESRNVVICQERNTLINEALANSLRNRLDFSVE